jgi:hypothetical protein
MAENTRYEVLSRFFASIFQAVFVKYFYLTLVAVGLGASFLPVLFPSASQSLLVRTIARIGEAILVAGVVNLHAVFRLPRYRW